MADNQPSFVYCQNPKCKLYQVRKLALKMGGDIQIRHKSMVVIIKNPDRCTVACPACRRATIISESA